MSTRTAALLGLCLARLAAADATIPSADVRGSRDSALLRRYEGSLIVAYEHRSFGELVLPLSRLEPVAGKTDASNNQVHEPRSARKLEGATTRIVYLIPENRSSLEVLRNYQEEVRGAGGKLLYECSGAGCGGDAGRSLEGGGGDTSLAMLLYPVERLTAEHHTTPFCAVAERIADQRYAAAELQGAHASILVYTVNSPDENDSCHALNARTIVVLDLVEARAREQKMVTVAAGEMARSIAGTGRVALYGIYFDFNQATVKPESEPTLAEIGRLLAGNPSLNLLVVGHTDSVGGYSFNLDLSQRRAAAVTQALTARHGAGRERLTPVGVSFASPAASNKSEEGRAKNRRVELVEP